MPPSKKLIFISCGQYTAEEKQLGQQVASLVKEHTTFEPYFAQNQTTVEGMTENILDALNRSVGLIAIMHKRGLVKTPNGELVRASVWIEQEIAVAAFLEHILRRKLFVRAYIASGIAREGMRDKLLINAVEFTDDQEVVADLKKILPEWGSVLSRAEIEQSIEDLDVSLQILDGKGPFFAIQMEHNFTEPIFVREIRLCSDGYELSEPARPQDSNDWRIPPAFPYRLSWSPDKNPAASLVQLHPNAGLKFRVPLEVTLLCEVLGNRTKFTKKLWVKVNKSQPGFDQLV